jgi:hypothetical protein
LEDEEQETILGSHKEDNAYSTGNTYCIYSSHEEDDNALQATVEYRGKRKVNEDVYMDAQWAVPEKGERVRIQLPVRRSQAGMMNIMSSFRDENPNFKVLQPKNEELRYHIVDGMFDPRSNYFARNHKVVETAYDRARKKPYKAQNRDDVAN